MEGKGGLGKIGSGKAIVASDLENEGDKWEDF